MRLLAAELRKLATLPGVWIGAAVSLLVPAGFVIIAARQAAHYGVLPDADDGYGQLALLGVIGAIVIGVLAVASEYAAEDAESGGGRPIATSLTVRPGRLGLLAAKLSATGLVVVLAAAVSTPATLVVSSLANFGDLSAVGVGDVGRGLGVVIYWLLTALIAAGITLLTRGGTIPMAVLIVNSSVVSVTYLLSQRVAAANFFPDLAGIAMFIRTRPTSLTIEPLVGGLVMFGWTVALLAIGAAVFQRRDA